MTFAWEGFSIEHPEEWAPLVVSGARKEGYVRLSSSGRVSCQIRWKHGDEGVALESRLDGYLDKLRRDGKKAKTGFKSEVDTGDGKIRYRYSGPAFGRGCLFFDSETSRVFFVEVTSTRNDSVLAKFREVERSFRSGVERWAILGLDVTVPHEASVESKKFLSGRTELGLRCRGAHITANRWGLAEQLLARHGLAEWCRHALGMDRARVENSDIGVKLVDRGSWAKPATVALVQHQKELNQLVSVKVKSRGEEWAPQWDWLN